MGGGGKGGARFSEFFTKNPNLKYNVFWGWGGKWGGRSGSVAMVSDFFYKESKSKKKIQVGGRMAWVINFFFTKNPNLKK